MTHLYTARARFDKNSDAGTLTWDDYIEWSKLKHLTELVSMDIRLNEPLVEPDRTQEADWKEIVTAGVYETGFYRTMDYVLKKIKPAPRFNLLALVFQPRTDCSLVQLDDFDFLGYDLLDRYYDTSALSNCGGFDETFLPADLNNVGLIDDYDKAYSIRRNLLKNNPMEEHADTNVIAIWRHRAIGW